VVSNIPRSSKPAKKNPKKLSFLEAKLKHDTFLQLLFHFEGSMKQECCVYKNISLQRSKNHLRLKAWFKASYQSPEFNPQYHQKPKNTRNCIFYYKPYSLWERGSI
jgi:hypothetical protein